MNTRFEDIRPAVDGTCEWLFRHPSYQNWAAHDRGLLWIRGKPGSGKSTLLRYALDNVTADRDNVGELLVLSFFFHGRGTPLQKTPAGLFRSIAHQLLHNVPETMTGLVRTFAQRNQTMGAHGSGWKWHERELQAAIESSISKALSTRSICLYVDALDETGEENADRLVKMFQSWLQKLAPGHSRWQICFTCRHYPVIDVPSAFQIHTERENKEDIRRYLAMKGSSIPPNIVDMTMHRSSGVFMWALLVVERMQGLNRRGLPWKAIGPEIRKTPGELTALYKGLIQELLVKDKATTLKLAQCICFARRPLTPTELQWAITIGSNSAYTSIEQYKYAQANGIDMERRVRDLSGGLAEVLQPHPVLPPSDGVVQFIHEDSSRVLLG